jgi:multidrug resistance protein, MATE family
MEPLPPRPSYPFEVKSRDIFRIALPASVAFITEPLVGLVDITVIGRLGDPALLGGLVLGSLLFDVIFSLAYFLRLGTAGLTAQAIGQRDPKDGLMPVARSIVAAVVLGLVLIALQWPIFQLAMLVWAPSPAVAAALSTYFSVRLLTAPFSLINYALLGWLYGRANARTGMALQILIHAVNIVLNLLLVFGLGWGVAGTALATVMANAVAAIAGLGILARHYGGLRTLIALIVPTELLDATALRRMFSLSRDITIRSVALMASYAYFAAQGSRLGEIVLSGNAILMNLLMIMAFFLDGLAQAAEQLSGKAVGANWPKAFDSALRLSAGWGVVIGGILTALMWLAGPAIIAVMTTNEAARAQAIAYLPLAATTGLTGMPAFVMDGVVSGATLNTVMRNGMLLALAIFLAVALVFEPILGVTGLWLAMHAFFIARGLLLWWGTERLKPRLFAPTPA